MNDAGKPNEFSVALRAMTEADLPAVMQLERSIFPDPWPMSAFTDVLSGEMWQSLVAECDNNIVGYACFMTAAGETHLANIAVHPDYRRKSVAQQLLDRILQLVTRHGCTMIILEVRQSNYAARAFYERSGFRTLYTRPHYYEEPAEDALVMVRYFEPLHREN